MSILVVLFYIIEILKLVRAFKDFQIIRLKFYLGFDLIKTI